jgi:hypothetical protein
MSRALFIVRALDQEERAARKKRMVALFPDGTVTYFGSPNGFTYIDGADEQTKQNYLARHRPREDWSVQGRKTAGWLSRYILWGPYQNIKKNVKDRGGRLV